MKAKDVASFVKSNGFPVSDVHEAYEFHEMTKSAPSTGAARNINAGTYMRSERGVTEISRNRRIFPALRSQPLPKPVAPTMPLSEIWRRRTSCHRFVKENMPLETLSSVLGAVQITRRATSKDYPHLSLGFRSYPSGGGLYPVEIYLVPFRVENLPPAVYHYSAHEHALTAVAKVAPDDPRFTRALLDHEEAGSGDLLNAASVLFLLTMLPQRALVKYGHLGYRFVVQEAGIVSHHLNIAACAFQHGVLHWAGYYDDLINDILGVDGIEETVVHTFWCGKPAPDPPPES